MAASSTIRVRRDQFLDPRWRLSNLYWITDKAGRAVQFVPNSAQLKFMDEVHTLNLILKARQLGFTTLCCLIYLDACVFTPHTRPGSSPTSSRTRRSSSATRSNSPMIDS